MSVFDVVPEASTAVPVPPDPRLVSAVGMSHSLESAVADIVDNSIDAGAHNVHVQFLRTENAVTGLLVADDGRGMTRAELDTAMRYGGRREYADEALGHFGIGLKAASMSQADELAVYTRRAGYAFQGRWMSRTSVNAGAPEVRSYSSADTQSVFTSVDVPFPLHNGTIVHLARPRNFIASDDPAEVSEWLSRAKSNLALHLGIVHHRALAAGRVTIGVGDFDEEFGEAGIPTTVTAVDPFGYRHSGADGYPRTFFGSIDGTDFDFEAHVWPESGRRDVEFLLDSSDGFERQGFYVYRNGRLLQAGGWNGLRSLTEPRRFARVRLEVPKDLESHVRMNPEKQGIEFSGPFRQAVLAARTVDGETGFDSFLAASEAADKRSRRRNRREELVVKPAKGLPGSVVTAIEDNLGFDPETEPVVIEWGSLPPTSVFEVDPTSHTLILNKRHHEVLTGLTGTGKPAGPRQAPLLTTLIYLLAREDLRRTIAGKQWSAEQERLQRVLHSALLAQVEWEKRMRIGGHRDPENNEE